MTRLTRLCRAVGVGLAVAATTLSVAGVAHAEPAPPNLDKAPTIAVGTGNKVFLVAKVSTGVQIYNCTANTNPATSGTTPFIWTFDHPEATLVGDNGKEIIQHSAGPTWQAKDGSKVVAAVEERATPDATAIPWLRLKATSTAAGSGGDRLVATTFIQRVNTKGGVAPAPTDPANPCNASTVGKQQARVDYKADYYFWKATGPGGT
jgi:hypothetical protein